MAFVLLQHLDPKQPSLLSEIIARSTAMPVQEVEDGMAVCPQSALCDPVRAGDGDSRRAAAATVSGAHPGQ